MPKEERMKFVQLSMFGNELGDNSVKINKQFNDDLQRQIDGKLPTNHIYNLGRPSEKLLSAGIPDLDIIVHAAKLKAKSQQENHPFDLADMKNLPDRIQNPLAIFNSKHEGNFVILTELQQKDKNYVVALEGNKQQGKIFINGVRSVHPKKDISVVHWINDGYLKYADKEKMADWLSNRNRQANHDEVSRAISHIKSSPDQQQCNSAEVAFGLPDNQAQQGNQSPIDNILHSSQKVKEKFEFNEKKVENPQWVQMKSDKFGNVVAFGDKNDNLKRVYLLTEKNSDTVSISIPDGKGGRKKLATSNDIPIEKMKPLIEAQYNDIMAGKPLVYNIPEIKIESKPVVPNKPIADDSGLSL
jgi:hypothetical protein